MAVPGLVQQLRRGIGHDLLWLPAAPPWCCTRARYTRARADNGNCGGLITTSWSRGRARCGPPSGVPGGDGVDHHRSS
ncbi:hypothetical protein QJS66_08375 [Kocuria rhizophila]|nr:hypothetical protein QJS66_08375 [Kocuria rhizophila]